MKALRNLLVVAIVATGAYHYRTEIGDAAWFIKDRYFSPAPCTQPITYSIGSFDSKFGITESQFAAYIAEAGQLWSAAEGKPLFQYDAASNGIEDRSRQLKVNLIYDYRQRATSQMQALNETIQGNLSTYDDLKAQYDALNASYKAKKAQLDVLTAQFQSDKQAYDSDVAYWNARGGAPKQEYARIEAERAALNAKSTQINQAVAALNDMGATLNSTGKRLNSLASSLNLTVKTYNAVGESTGPEFDEGQYVEDATGKRVDIYQFATHDMLVRVLAHELGHALGLDHVEDSQAVMYRLNQSDSDKLTSADIAELKRVCKN